MTKINHAVICVAGIGSRLGKKMPKALVDIRKDKKIIDYQLDLVEDINLVSLVVGYKCDDVLDYVRDKREDLRIVYNRDFKNNSTAFSINLAIKDFDEPYISMDGDLLINKNEFDNFINSFKGETLLGITPSKTEDGVYVNLNNNQEVISFQRQPKTQFEWANIACINTIPIEKNNEYVYTQFKEYLPLKSFIFENLFEIDTPNDLKFALDNIDKF